jgi:putative DNA primase/helicase
MTESKDSFEVEAAAFVYAQKGWKVFPVHAVGPGGICTCGKPDCSHPGKHPRYHPDDLKSGGKDATDDLDKIDRWWSRWPGTNIGVTTGKVSNLVVIDLDYKGEISGFDSLRALEEEYGSLPPTLSATTGSGGKHLYYEYPSAYDKIPSSAGTVGPGIDIRADGGYVVAPPSTHITNNIYKWDIEEAPITQLPQWMVDLIVGDSTTFSMDDFKAKAKSIPEGKRNSTLFQMACSYRGKGFGEEEILALLRMNNEKYCNPPVDDDELVLLSTNVSINYPSNIEKVKSNINRSAVDEIIATDLDYTPRGLIFRYVVANIDDCRFCYHTKMWYFYDGVQWSEHSGGEPDRRAHQIVRSMRMEANQLPPGTNRDSYIKFVRMSSNNRQVDLTIAGAKPHLEIGYDKLDSNPYLLNCLNGTVDLSSGLAVLKDHDLDDFITMVAPVDYDPQLECPLWVSHLSKIFMDDEETIEAFQRICGYLLVDSNPEQLIFIHWGSGKNGKSTTFNAIQHVLGRYATSTSPETFMPRAKGASTNDIARLHRRRVVFTSEPDAGSKLSESFFKTATGGDAMMARYLYQEFFEFVATFKVFFGTNHRPKLRENDEAVWRRIVLIPYEHVFSEDERIKGIEEKFKQEASGIFAWMVKGYEKYADKETGGLLLSTKIKSATKTYRATYDTMNEYFTERCKFGAEESVSKADLYADLVSWCDSRSEERMTHKKFSMTIHDRYPAVLDSRIKGVYSWKGISLNTELDSSLSAQIKRSAQSKIGIGGNR